MGHRSGDNAKFVPESNADRAFALVTESRCRIQTADLYLRSERFSARTSVTCDFSASTPAQDRRHAITCHSFLRGGTPFSVVLSWGGEDELRPDEERQEITEAVIEEIVADAESGYDLDKLLERRGLKRDPDS
jgi:hypothetical protein